MQLRAAKLQLNNERGPSAAKLQLNMENVYVSNKLCNY